MEEQKEKMVELEDAYDKQIQRAHILLYAGQIFSDYRNADSSVSVSVNWDNMDPLKENLLDWAINSTYYAGVISWAEIGRMRHLLFR